MSITSVSVGSSVTATTNSGVGVRWAGSGSNELAKAAIEVQESQGGGFVLVGILAHGLEGRALYASTKSRIVRVRTLNGSPAGAVEVFTDSDYTNLARQSGAGS